MPLPSPSLLPPAASSQAPPRLPPQARWPRPPPSLRPAPSPARGSLAVADQALGGPPPSSLAERDQGARGAPWLRTAALQHRRPAVGGSRAAGFGGGGGGGPRRIRAVGSRAGAAARRASPAAILSPECRASPAAIPPRRSSSSPLRAARRAPSPSPLLPARRGRGCEPRGGAGPPRPRNGGGRGCRLVGAQARLGHAAEEAAAANPAWAQARFAAASASLPSATRLRVRCGRGARDGAPSPPPSPLQFLCSTAAPSPSSSLLPPSPMAARIRSFPVHSLEPELDSAPASRGAATPPLLHPRSPVGRWARVQVRAAPPRRSVVGPGCRCVQLRPAGGSSDAELGAVGLARGERAPRHVNSLRKTATFSSFGEPRLVRNHTK
ncbi:hypothetical protein PVAP13_3KG062654 [Panicum virgatum]|uniref:Uncharacterized protein n=1 Tax=Panicum virgatum TaxID=38727 RepID=A0A8T0UFN8_PANVG|nr:hypothetical protein PVAP13_3KG062654 [Panicum virgatum]